jgi:hypothetical protein
MAREKGKRKNENRRKHCILFDDIFIVKGAKYERKGKKKKVNLGWVLLVFVDHRKRIKEG